MRGSHRPAAVGSAGGQADAARCPPALTVRKGALTACSTTGPITRR